MANKRKCLCCGRTYEWCSCDKYRDYPTWYNTFDNQNCHDIWHVLSDFESGILSKDEALERMKPLNPSVITNANALESYKKLTAEAPATMVEAETPTPAEEKTMANPEDETLSVSEELKRHSAKKKAVKKN